MKKKPTLALVASVGPLLLIMFNLAAVAAPAETPPANQPSTETRKAMAEAHRKMADCLASNKTMKECRKEMRTAMADKMGCHCGEEKS